MRENIGLGPARQVEQRADRVADKPVQSAVLITRSRNAAVSKQSPTAPQMASLQLLCFDGDPVVRLHFSSNVGSNRNSRLTYKADNSPARRPNARILQDFQTVMIEDKKEVAQLAADLQQPVGQRVLRRCPDHSGGNQAMIAAVAFDNTIAGALGAAVDAEDAHGG